MNDLVIINKNLPFDSAVKLTLHALDTHDASLLWPAHSGTFVAFSSRFFLFPSVGTVVTHHELDCGGLERKVRQGVCQ